MLTSNQVKQLEQIFPTFLGPIDKGLHHAWNFEDLPWEVFLLNKFLTDQSIFMWSFDNVTKSMMVRKDEDVLFFGEFIDCIAQYYIADSDKEKQYIFKKSLENASDIVSSWPTWKQMLLGSLPEKPKPSKDPESGTMYKGG